MERKVNVIEDIDGKKTVFIHVIQMASYLYLDCQWEHITWKKLPAQMVLF